MFVKKSSSWQTLSDEELVHLYKKEGNKYAFGELFKRYTHLVYGVCIKYLKNKEESRDAVMQVFEKLLEDLKKHEVNLFKNWLYRVTKNFCLMKLRKKESFTFLEENTKAINMDFEEDLHLIKEAKLAHLEAGIKQLNEEQRNCIVLFYLEKKSYQEVSILTGYGMNEVKSHLQNGKRNLKNYILMKNGESKS